MLINYIFVGRMILVEWSGDEIRVSLKFEEDSVSKYMLSTEPFLVATMF